MQPTGLPAAKSRVDKCSEKQDKEEEDEEEEEEENFFKIVI